MKKGQKQNKAGKKNSLPVAKVAASDRWKYFTALAIIVLITLFAYLPVLQNGFIWDDETYIKNNLLIRSVNLKDCFSGYVGGNYHPLTILTLAIEYHFFGLNETGYHAVNLLLHLLNVILVFYTIFLLSNKAAVALVTALLFGIHPMHVESVAWAIELKDLLYTFFFLGSYIFYLKYLKNPQSRFYVFAVLLFSFSLLSKAMAASLPVLLLLTDYFKGRKINIKTLFEKVPFFLLAFTLGAVAVLAQRTSGAIQDIALTFFQRIVFACYGFITYLMKLALPLNLSAFYPYPKRYGGDIPMQYYVYLLLFSGLIVSVFYSLRFSKKIFFGLGFFAVTVFLVLQLLPVGAAIMADRYSYIPSIGIFYLAGEGLNLLWSKKFKLIFISLLTAFALFFTVFTYNRIKIWNNEMTFWNDIISQYQTMPESYYSRGLVFMNEKRYEEALKDYDKAIQLKPGYVEAYVNRGVIFINEKRNEEALINFKKVIELKPDFVLAYYNCGVVLHNEKKYEEAISSYSKAIELKPDYAQAYYGRGLAEYYAGKKDTACSDVKKSARLGFQPPAEALQEICK